MKCRFCGHPVTESVADLGMSPLANSYIQPGQEQKGEMVYPLHAYVCSHCFLVQVDEFQKAESIFSDYAYFSSYSTAWLEHCREYAGQIIQKCGLNRDSLVVEAASNDGYLLQFFQQEGIPVLGIEPARNVAETARAKGIETLAEFFCPGLAQRLAGEGRRADLFIGNNVLAHVPDLNGFVEAIRLILKPQGTVTMEFPHLLNLLRFNQFDTIYHEHFSYFSLHTAREVFRRQMLKIYDLDQLETHGGSLRIYACHAQEDRPETERLRHVLQLEQEAGLTSLQTYRAFEEQVRETKRSILSFLIEARRQGRSIAAYGAPAKGNTLLNYCGIGRDFIDYTVDRNPHKQGMLLPGSRIPVYPVERLFETKPDDILLLPWNLTEEILSQIRPQCSWNPRFVRLIPEVCVV